jgi:hypothetical protein
MQAKRLIVLSVFMIPVAIAVLGGGLADAFGVARASAAEVVERTMATIPDAVRDRRMDLEIATRRRQIHESKVALGVSRGRVERMRAALERDEAAAEMRTTILRDAAVALRAADREGRALVHLAGVDRPVADVREQVRELAAAEQGDRERTEDRRKSLARLLSGVEQAERCIARLEHSMTSLVSEVDMLRTRRFNAALESRNLDMIGAICAAADPTMSEIGGEAERLRQEILRLEIGNDARRHSLAGEELAIEQDFRVERELAVGHGAAAGVGQEPGQDANDARRP